MSTTLPFFSDEAAYRRWIQSMPGISRVSQLCDGTYQEELAEDVDGPYLVAPGSEWLILRVGFPYCAVRRVQSPDEADFTWYVPRTRDDGEQVYSAYLWDERVKPKKIISGNTLRDARGALDEYLSSRRHPKETKRLLTRQLPRESQEDQG